MISHEIECAEDGKYTLRIAYYDDAVHVLDSDNEHVYIDKSILRKFITNLEQIAKDLGV